MPSIILSTATRYLLPLLMLFSVFILFRGHNDPGGGFIGGLVAAAAYSLYALAYGVKRARKLLIIAPRSLMGFGLLTALCSGLVALLFGKPFLTGLWLDSELPLIGKPGTPLFFDIGVYLVVVGVTLTIVFTLREEG